MLAALAFLTPFGGARAPDRRTLGWLPLAGAVIGAVVGVAWWGAGRIWPPALAAAVVVAVDLAVTGMLHLDGLIDSADGVLPHLPRERRLAVMTEPTVGAFGVGAAAAVLLVRFGAITSLEPDIALIAGLWAASRTAMAVTARALPYAREHGLVTSFRGGDWRAVALYGAALALGLAVLGAGLQGAVAVVAGVGMAGAFVALARHRLGGFTGDVLGAAGMVVETGGLLVVAASW